MKSLSIDAKKAVSLTLSQINGSTSSFISVFLLYCFDPLNVCFDLTIADYLFLNKQGIKNLNRLNSLFSKHKFLKKTELVSFSLKYVSVSSESILTSKIFGRKKFSRNTSAEIYSARAFRFRRIYFR